MKKRGLSAAMLTGAAVALTIGTLVPAAMAASSSANNSSVPKLSESQAKAIAEKTFSIPAGYALQGENYNQGNQGMESSYNFNYQSQNGSLNDSININLDANTGVILGYSHYTPNSGFTFPASVSEAQAKGMALAWANKLYPGKMTQVRLISPTPQPQPLTTSTVYTFNFARMIDGVLAPSDGITIAIDQNGNLSSVNYHWTTQGLPSISPRISFARAESIFGKSALLHLAYVQQWVAGNLAQNILAYVEDQPDSNVYFSGGQFAGDQGIGTPVIDAENGKLIDSAGNAYVMTPYTPPSPLVTGGPSWPAALPKVNWDETQSLQYAQRAVTGLGYSLKNLKLLTNSEYGGGNNDTTWNFSWSAPYGRQVNVGIDATYGYLNSFNQFTPINKFGKLGPNWGIPHKVKVSQTQALATATRALKALYPGDTSGLSLKLQPNQNTKFGNGWGFEIDSLANGIPNQANFGNIEIDWTTGEVQNLYWGYSVPTNSLPSPSSAISLAKAESLWQGLAKLQLEYLQVYGKGTPRTLLVYAPILPSGYNLTLDATTGKFLYAGFAKGTLPYSGPIKDLAEVQGAAQIQILGDRDLIPVSPTGQVNPKQVVTLGDFIQLLTTAFPQSNNDNLAPEQPLPGSLKALLQQVPRTSLQEQQAIETAYQLGWLPSGESLEVNAPLNRLEAAEILARVLDLGPFLAHPKAFSLQATDASSLSSSQYAAVALAVSLGLIPLQNGAYNPAASMDLSDEAIAVVETATVASQMHLFDQIRK